MDFDPTSEQKLLRDSIVRFARGELNHDVAGRDRAQAFSRELWRQCGAVGLLGLPVPEEYGGTNADPLSCAIALDALGYGCHDGGLVFSVCAHVLACVVPIWQHGSEAQKRHWLPGLCQGTLVGAHAITEADSGSDTFAMRMRAQRTEGGWRLSGSKTFISNAAEADVALVFALTDADKGFHGGVTVSWWIAARPGSRRARASRRWACARRRSASWCSTTCASLTTPCSAALAAGPVCSGRR